MTSQLKFHGVIPITPTPFTAEGAVDVASLKRLVDFMVGERVQGLAILGFLGENHKLSGEERRLVLRTVRDQNAGRLQLFVGVRAFGAAGAIEQAQEARLEGNADGVFVAPIGVQNDGVLYEFFKEVAESAGLPVMLHDFPDSFGTVLSPELIGRLARGVPGVIGIKLEELPVMTKLTRLLELAPDFSIFGGLGGMFFLEELQRGAHGIMTGFSFPSVLVEIFERFQAGDESGATRVFDEKSPLLRYEFQPKIGLAFRKHVFKRLGVFASDHIRPPGAKLDARTVDEYEAIIKRVGLSLDPTPAKL